MLKVLRKNTMGIQMIEQSTKQVANASAQEGKGFLSGWA